jgi:nicotinamide riboside kinase
VTPALPVGCVIALLGAEGTGKTQLANALTARLLQRGISAELVPDVSSEWRTRLGRDLNAVERAEMATEQTVRIASAAERGVVVADTTALIAAVEGEIHSSGETSLYDLALAAHRGYAITLLMALDLPQATDQASSERAQSADALVRAALARAGSPFAVIHGRGPERLASAWNAINSRAESAGVSSSSGRSANGERPWFWPCDRCPDPACEHRLFRDLLAKRP